MQKLFNEDTDGLVEGRRELGTAVQDALVDLNFAQTELTQHRDVHDGVK